MTDCFLTPSAGLFRYSNPHPLPAFAAILKISSVRLKTAQIQLAKATLNK
jgi:hypothetical protein